MNQSLEDQQHYPQKKINNQMEWMKDKEIRLKVNSVKQKGNMDWVEY